MKKTCLFLTGLFVSVFGLFAQKADTTHYRSRKLTLSEVNLVSSYYNQDGNNSAVTGGTGTEALSDYSNQFEVKLHSFNRHGREVSWEASLGVDYYTSASSDKINPYSISSASARDLRIYPSVTRRVLADSSGMSWFAGVSYSHESDYRSYGLHGGFGRRSSDRNSEWSFKAQFFFDQVKMILPIELRTPATGGFPGAPNEYEYPWSKRNTLAGTFSWSRILNSRLQVMATSELTYQHGFLGLPFHRIYFKDFSLGTEKLPSVRIKWPIAVRASWFAGDRLIIRPSYRFYLDDWGLAAHTAELEAVIKTGKFLSISPFYRFYSQSGIRYFAGYLEHQHTEKYYSSNFDLSGFNSHFFGGGLRYTPWKGVLGIRHLSALEIRYGHYQRSNGLSADIVSLYLTYKRT